MSSLVEDALAEGPVDCPPSGENTEGLAFGNGGTSGGGGGTSFSAGSPISSFFQHNQWALHLKHEETREGETLMQAGHRLTGMPCHCRLSQVVIGYIFASR